MQQVRETFSYLYLCAFECLKVSKIQQPKSIITPSPFWLLLLFSAKFDAALGTSNMVYVHEMKNTPLLFLDLHAPACGRWCWHHFSKPSHRQILQPRTPVSVENACFSCVCNPLNASRCMHGYLSHCSTYRHLYVQVCAQALTPINTTILLPDS